MASLGHRRLPDFLDVIVHAGFMPSTASLAIITLRDRATGKAAARPISELHQLFSDLGLGIETSFSYSAPSG